MVILTSNRTREVHDALKRRCIYFWIDYPRFEKEYEIIRAKVPDAPQRLAQEVTRFVEELRQADLYKIPGVAETIDWTAALVALDQDALSLEIVQRYAGRGAQIPGRHRQDRRGNGAADSVARQGVHVSQQVIFWLSLAEHGSIRPFAARGGPGCEPRTDDRPGAGSGFC